MRGTAAAVSIFVFPSLKSTTRQIEPNVTNKMVSLAYECFLLKKFINNYEKTMLAQYPVRYKKLICEIQRISFKAVNSPQVSKERAFHVRLLVERF